MDDFERQIQIFEEIALQLSINSKYQPVYFLDNKYYEKVLLSDFQQYQNYSSLTGECFLYYGQDTIFLSSGNTEGLDIYLQDFEKEDQDTLKAALSETLTTLKMITISDDIYVFIPFRVFEVNQKNTVMLCFIIRHDDLTERFQVISGGIEGNLSLYKESNLIYCNQEYPVSMEQEDVLITSSLNGMFTLNYLPNPEDYIVRGLFPLQVLLVTADVLLVLVIANTFANRSYRPIRDLTEKYRKKIALSEDIQCKNVMEEIDYMMDSVIQDNVSAIEQMKQKHELLSRQLLQMLISGNASFDVHTYLDKLQIRLPGPYYYVISISFEKETNITADFLTSVCKEMEMISANEEGIFVYVVCEYDEKRLSAICSIKEMGQKDELTDYLGAIAESYEYEPFVGIGNVYQKLTRISASWIESIDYIDKKSMNQEMTQQKDYIYNFDELYRILTALSNGDENSAVTILERYVNQLEKKSVSLLMLQYICADFMGEIIRIAKEQHVELSNQNVSLIISAKSTENFREAALEMIHDYCEKLSLLQCNARNTEDRRVLEYVNQHFFEYDLTIEKAAADLGTTILAVRQSVYKQTGKLYKDYIIYLRIEYAKTLLLKEGMTVEKTCQKVGYGNISHFIKVFKEITGTTPSRYKRGE